MINKLESYNLDVKNLRKIRNNILQTAIELKRYEDGTQKKERALEKMQNLLSMEKMLGKRINDFSEKYFKFSAKEVFEEFKKVCKLHGLKEPRMIVTLNAEIAHELNKPEIDKKMSVNECITYFNKIGNLREKKDSHLFLCIVQNRDEEKMFKFSNNIELDFEMEFTDGTKLKDNIYTKLYHIKYNDERLSDEYFTGLEIKKSAIDYIPVVLDSSKNFFDDKVIGEVFDNLHKKALLQNMNEKSKDEFEM